MDDCYSFFLLSFDDPTVDANKVLASKKLIEWAGNDPDHDARLSSLRLMSTICKDTPLTGAYTLPEIRAAGVILPQKKPSAR